MIESPAMKTSLPIKLLVSFGISVLCVINCEKPEHVTIIETGTVQEVTSTSVTVTGNIIDVGEGIYTYGHMASTDSSYTENTRKSILASPKTGIYYSTVTCLNPDTLYYVRAYATGSNGTVYGKSVFGKSISTHTLIEELLTGTMTDSRDGHEYNWVKIGSQVWMSENLAYLPSVSPLSEGITNSAYYYVYGYNGTSVSEAKATVNYATYGVLYNWPAAMDGKTSSDANPSGVQGVCPSGWHLPSDTEWKELVNYLCGEEIAGGKMKETGCEHWWYPNYGATNSSGFMALPGGSNNPHGYSGWTGHLGFFWSATAYFTFEAEYYYLDCNSDDVINVNEYKGTGFSVRCVKD
jgi:uncharacterized protein (TIGR02145 family)